MQNEKKEQLDKLLLLFLYTAVVAAAAVIKTPLISAAHSKEDLDFAIRCFKEVRSEMGL